MRLIDADRVMQSIDMQMIIARELLSNKSQSQEFVSIAEQSFKQEISNAPTVKAIPIEWLMKKADEWATKDITYDGKPYMFTAQQVGLAIALMVNDWEKENVTEITD